MGTRPVVTQEALSALIPEQLVAFRDLILQDARQAILLDTATDSSAFRYLSQANVPPGSKWSPGYLHDSPLDGKSFFLQLSLDAIPEICQLPGAPYSGTLLVTLDLSSDWKVDVFHDPVPSSMEFSASWPLAWSVAALPSYIESLYDDHLADIYERFEQKVNGQLKAQVGGHHTLIQSSNQDDVVCSIGPIEFVGDSGKVSIHWNENRGWYGLAESH